MNSKNPVFGPFTPFTRKNNFSWKIQLSRTNSYGFPGPCQNLEKFSDTIQRKCLERWKETDKPYFISQRKVLHIAADSNVWKRTFFIYFIIAYPSQLSVGHWYTSGLSFGQIFQQLQQYSIAVISLSDHAPWKNNVH